MTRPMTPATRGFAIFKSKMIAQIDRNKKADAVEKAVVYDTGGKVDHMPIRMNASGQPIPY